MAPKKEPPKTFLAAFIRRAIIGSNIFFFGLYAGLYLYTQFFNQIRSDDPGAFGLIVVFIWLAFFMIFILLPLWIIDISYYFYMARKYTLSINEKKSNKRMLILITIIFLCLFTSFVVCSNFILCHTFSL